MIIAIDGPAGSGKSTVAKLVAQRLRFQCVDTGAMYRAITWKAVERAISLEDEDSLADLVQKSLFRFFTDSQGELRLELDGKDITEAIRKQVVTQKVSIVSKHPQVRKAMVAWQRKLAKGLNLVMEGRDIGTVVFPNARWKFYLEADFPTRVRRRYEEQRKTNSKITLGEVQQTMQERDYLDSHRKVSPLTKAPNAVYIDTTHLAPEEVTQRVLQKAGV